MAYAGIQVRGLNELRKALRQAEDSSLRKALTTANKAAAQLVADRAIPRAPRRTGKLAGSVKALATQTKGRVKAGRKSVPYAAAVHWGRKRGNVGRPPGNRYRANPIAPNPFIWEAAQRHRRQVAYEYDKAINELVVMVINSVKG